MPLCLKKRPFKAAKISLPASKSISNRALIINALSGAGMMPQNISDCDDTCVMVRALTGGNMRNADGMEVIDIMAAGTAMRFLTAYLSVTEGENIITGTERMQHRPIALLVDALRHLGAEISYVNEEGFPPLHIKGKKLEGGKVTLSSNVSSQYISAMLMVGPILEKGLVLQLEGDIVSRPYIDMTLGIMRTFGAKTDFTGNTITVEPTGYTAVPYYIENDWSASSYWFEMVALTPGSEICLPGLFIESLQGDQGVREIFEKLGVESTSTDIPYSKNNGEDVEKKTISAFVLRHTGRVAERLDIDMLRVPDLAQTVVVTCCMLNIPFRITGLQSLKIKETDRIAALRTELGKLGFVVGEENDSVLYWNGERCEVAEDCSIDTYEDHRMAMAFAPCCQILGEITINNPQVVSKSYPSFWQDFDSIET